MMQPIQEVQAYLTIQSVKKRYDVGNTTVYRWMDDKNVNFPKPTRLGNRCVRWKLADLEQWERERQEQVA